MKKLFCLLLTLWSLAARARLDQREDSFKGAAPCRRRLQKVCTLAIKNGQAAGQGSRGQASSIGRRLSDRGQSTGGGVSTTPRRHASITTFAARTQHREACSISTAQLRAAQSSIRQGDLAKPDFRSGLNARARPMPSWPHDATRRLRHYAAWLPKRSEGFNNRGASYLALARSSSARPTSTTPAAQNPTSRGVPEPAPSAYYATRTTPPRRSDANAVLTRSPKNAAVL